MSSKFAYNAGKCGLLPKREIWGGGGGGRGNTLLSDRDNVLSHYSATCWGDAESHLSV